jgi:hypothetical protein
VAPLFSITYGHFINVKQASLTPLLTPATIVPENIKCFKNPYTPDIQNAVNFLDYEKQ